LLGLNGIEHFFIQFYNGWMPYPAEYHNIFEVVILWAIFYMDYRYSIVIGVLVGISSAMTHRQYVSLYGCLAFFISIQTVTYFGLLAVGAGLPTLLNTRNGLILGVAMLAITVGLRELTLALLWRFTARRLEIDVNEIRQFESHLYQVKGVR
jgi:hypothetical protein